MLSWKLSVFEIPLEFTANCLIETCIKLGADPGCDGYIWI